MALSKVLSVAVGRHVNFARTALVAKRGVSAPLFIIKQRFSTEDPRYDADPALYDKIFGEAREQPNEFWGKQSEGIDWFKKWNKVLDNSNPPFTKWFCGGELNICHNAVDRHVSAGYGDQTAVIYESPITDTRQKISYKELQEKVAKFAGVLSKHGVTKGDRVLIYMPMIPEAMVAMLASARIGAIHSLVFGGFASRELSTRINHAKPKVIVSTCCGIEPRRLVEYKPLLDHAIELSDYKPPICLIHRRPEEQVKRKVSVKMVAGRDVSLNEEMESARPHDCVPIDANHPLYLLYTSGTTGLPKAVVRPSGGHAVMLHWSMYNIYGMNPEDVWFAASDLGWVVGHSYITYAPLLHRNTTVLFEGKPVGAPDAGVFFRILEQYKVRGMFVAPTALRAIRKVDPEGKHALRYNHPEFKYLFVAGEHCDQDTMVWSKSVFKSPVLDNWWQTESGAAMTATCVGLGNNVFPTPGVAGKPVPGWDVDLLDKDDEDLGNIVVKLPLPPGSFSTLWEHDDRFKEVYFSKYPGYYDTMDSGYIDNHGNVAVMSRSDDVINVAGHRLSSGQLEEALGEHPDIAESAVVGRPDTLKGHVPLGLCVINDDVTKSKEALSKEIIQHVRDLVGPVASFRDVIFVPRLPKTRSGKVARSTILAMISGKPYKIPVTIEDPSVYPQLMEVLKAEGYDPRPPST